MTDKTRPRPSRLQRDIEARIVELIRQDRLEPGTRLTELALAERLLVSRTPVRAALEQLARKGVVAHRPNRGFVVAALPEAPAEEAAPTPSEDDRLLLAIARDRVSRFVPEEVTESDLMRRYGVSRNLLVRVLNKLAEAGVTERKPGHGWYFLPSIENPQARQESYRFRLLVEPNALLEPTFRLDPDWAADMRRRHKAMLAAPWRETSSIALFEMNAAFHEGLAAASGNRYLRMAVEQQSRLRRFANYDWIYGYERVVTSCTEHLAILDWLERGDREVAAMLLRRHLEQASTLTRPGEAPPPE